MKFFYIFFRTISRYLTWLAFGESEQLLRVGIRGKPKPFRPWFLIACSVVVGFFRATIKWEQHGLENIPSKGGVLVVSNHVSSADPPILAVCLFPRWPKYMAKIELFQKPIVGYLFALSGAFPVKRFSADLGALREAERLLKDGEVLGMFPEGHRSEKSELIDAHHGTALLALRSNSLVLPVAITGSEQFRSGWSVFFKRPKVKVVFGHPFQLNHEGRITRKAVEAASLRIMYEIAAQLPEKYRGVYRERFASLPREAAIDVGATDESI